MATLQGVHTKPKLGYPEHHHAVGRSSARSRRGLVPGSSSINSATPGLRLQVVKVAVWKTTLAFANTQDVQESQTIKVPDPFVKHPAIQVCMNLTQTSRKHGGFLLEGG